MSISWSSISAGAMTAAVSLGTTFQQVGASASAAASTLPTTAFNVVDTGAASTAKLASDMSLIEKPAKAMAAAVPKSSLLLRTAGFLSKALPIVTIGASALSGARIVNDDGAQALVTSRDGRGAVLGAVGGALLLVPHPATQLAAAGVLGAVAVNQFGGMSRFDRPASTGYVTPA